MFQKADLIYTDCWPKSDNYEESKKIKEKFLPYQIKEKNLEQLKDGSIFLPCPPVTRGNEVSEEAMKSKFCMNFEAKKYLLHTQNAIMEMISSRI